MSLSGDSGIRSMLKRGIAFKIAIGYLLIAIFTTGILGASFYTLVKNRLINETKVNLKTRGQVIVQKVAQHPLGQAVKPPYVVTESMGFQVRADYLVTDQQGAILVSTMPARFPVGSVLGNRFKPGTAVSPSLKAAIRAKGIEHLYQGAVIDQNDQEFVIVALPVTGSDGAKGNLILLTKLSALTAIGREMLNILLRSLIIGTIIALLLAVILGSRLAEPLKVLKEKAEQIACRQFTGRVEIQTGDEVEELGRSINSMAEQLSTYDAAQKRFLQNASHELKTPLMSIQGYAEGIKDGVLEGAEVSEGLDIIIRQSDRLKSLVEEIIYLSRLESVQDFYRFMPVDLHQLLKEAIDATRGMAGEKEVKLVLQNEIGLNIDADYDKLLRVLINVLGNAVRYARSAVAISVGMAGEQVEITVGDDGEGFDRQDLEHIFDRFYKGKKGSTGLGMAIVKTIIEAHNGRVTAVNRAAGGAEVKILLPVMH